jgi:AcrR family transcriptional regulator
MVMSVEGERNGGSSSSAAAEAFLTPQQNQALLLLGDGMAISEVAKKLGVHRATVYRWLKSDPPFRAAYNAWQVEQRESCRAMLLQCAQRASQRIAECVNVDSGLALRLVKSLGMLSAGEPLPIDPKTVKQVIRLEEMEEKSALERRWDEQFDGGRPDANALLAALRRFGPSAGDAKAQANPAK